MGTCFDVNQFNLDTNITAGIIPRAARHLFEGMEERKLAAKTNSAVEPTFELNVQFIEVFRLLKYLITNLNLSFIMKK